MNARKLMRAAGFIAAAAVLLASCGSSEDELVAEEPAFELQELTSGAVQVKVEGPGVLETYEQREIRSRISAEIISVAREGQRVGAGDPLVVFDSAALRTALRQAELNLEQGRLDADRTARQVTAAEADLEEARQLYDRGAISADQLSAAEEALDNARYSAGAANIRKQQFQLSYENAAADLAAAIIPAPFDGVVIRQYLTAGDLAGNSSLIMVYADDSRLRLVAEVDEYDIGKVAADMRVTVTSDVLGDEELSSRVDLISPAAEIVNNISIFSVSAIVDNSDLRLRPGMSADMSIMVASDRGIIVPSKLVQTVRGRSYINVWENGEEVIRRIEIGANDGVNTAVLSGLEEGEQIVVPVAPSLALPGMTGDTGGGTSIVPISVPGTGSK
jgi:HlyD family secretion protein